MTIVSLLVGVLMAASVFAAFFWSIAQVVQARGALRWIHGGTALAILAGAVCVSNAWAYVAAPVGVVLLGISVAAAMLDTGWARLLPVFPALFGIALILGLPFA